MEKVVYLPFTRKYDVYLTRVRQITQGNEEPGQLREESGLWGRGETIGYSKDGSKRKCEEQNDFHWLGEGRGGGCGPLSLRLTSHPASGSRFVLQTSGSGLPWSSLFLTSDREESVNKERGRAKSSHDLLTSSSYALRPSLTNLRSFPLSGC